MRSALPKSVKERRVVVVWNGDYFFNRGVILSEAGSDRLLVLVTPDGPTSASISNGFTAGSEAIYYEYAKIENGDVFMIAAKGLQTEWHCELKTGFI